MCGIFCYISRREPCPISAVTRQLLAQRGPDSFAEHTIRTDGGSHIQFLSSVLSMRGMDTVSQPLIDPNTGCILCWNGEAWGIDGVHVTENDTRMVLELLVQGGRDAGENDGVIAEVFSRIRGPYACIFYNALSDKLYYGRDCLGRRSLMLGKCGNGSIAIASVSDRELCDTWNEVEADGLYVVSLSQHADAIEVPLSIRRLPLHYLNDNSPSGGGMSTPYPSLNMELPSSSICRLTLQAHAVITLEELMKQSLQARTYRRPSSHHEAIAVLFSGGVDCTLLTYWCHELLPLHVPIDLLNVAFQNPRIHGEGLDDPYSICPDRKTGLSSLAALKQQCPGRQFNFVAINVPYSETIKHRNSVIELMYPHDTEMDLSIASALYFAARGQGVMTSNGNAQQYTTSSRILLSGLGADELFAGYSRHAIAYSRGGFSGLVAELKLDFERLGKRNLGRDDRVTSHWGREVRYPYLDESVVKWAIEAPVWHKCGFGTTSGDTAQPDLEDGKLILRLLAWRAGLLQTAQEKKRAIQFGARTAKMHARKTKGTDSISAHTDADLHVD